MWDLPDTVLVGDEYVALAPRESIGRVQAFDMALDPFSFAVTVLITQKREVPFLLLSHDYVAVRQHEQAARMLKSGRESGDRETFGCPRLLTLMGDRKRTARNDRSSLRRR